MRVRGEEKAAKDVKSHLGPGSSRLFQLQRLRLIEQLASPMVKWALSKKMKIKKRGKKQNSEISLYGQMTSCLPGWDMRKIINNKKKSALIFP